MGYYIADYITNCGTEKLFLGKHFYFSAENKISMQPMHRLILLMDLPGFRYWPGMD